MASQEVAEKLVRCFLAVFPSLPCEVVSTATKGKLKEWDSLASAMLTTLIHQEFGKRDTRRLMEMNSFQEILEFLGDTSEATKA